MTRRKRKLRPKKPGKNKCGCKNHLGGQKIQHKSKEAAWTWVMRVGVKRATGPFEVYKCPTSDRWHVRSGGLR